MHHVTLLSHSNTIQQQQITLHNIQKISSTQSHDYRLPNNPKQFPLPGRTPQNNFPRIITNISDTPLNTSVNALRKPDESARYHGNTV